LFESIVLNESRDQLCIFDINEISPTSWWRPLLHALLGILFNPWHYSNPAAGLLARRMWAMLAVLLYGTHVDIVTARRLS